MSTSHAVPLPPSRDFMTSLFNSLTSPPLPSSSTHNSNPISNNTDSNTNTTSASLSNPQRILKENERDNRNGNGNQNPLKQMNVQKKALLMTLHVIFPPPLLLHALDLLDRGGVGRIVLRGEGDVGEGVGTGEDMRDRMDGERKGIGGNSSGAGEKDLERGESVGVDNTRVGELTIDAQEAKISLFTSPSASTSPNKNYSLLPLSPSHPIPNPPSPPKTKPPTLYQVRSSQPSKWHSSRSASTSTFGTGTSHTTTENTYTVHLNAWNCSCAAFAYSAFPAFPASSSSSSSSSTTTTTTSSTTNPYPYPHPYIPTSTSASSTSYFPWDVQRRSPENQYPNSTSISIAEEKENWQYGGWTKSSQVPICKHLLACLLVERWGDVLGMYVRERVVGREEMAGLVV
ncbi:uncharacterized protein EAF01_008289 [Botrytis porri]|uniref:SWIM-type domain-containing protein n=1 Tax=Botrytis porri TaxID=87229 RepID=A0A4Z1KN27_9HELO|nr:uncharacterized protein EAF01_008289 [Botrytis porri]KAF7899076.1 hypothetical protein EAF01_008289 [Botrytis porri]TGO87513.1 hypothetical protein BPOR_0221g00100 [Botrytis porri]